MPKKSFVSLFFTHQKLQILSLNPAKTSVENFTTVDLPAGLIKNYIVQDKNALAEILKNSCQQLDLKEKFVGIVVPEFSTFTKSLILPHLETEELDEAVRWQLKEVLPAGGQEMVMDWKIVQLQKDKHQILAVAIQKDLLLSYVDAVSLAGLLPLVVETPSLSLTRVSDHKPTAKLVVYANFGEAILSLVKGDEIFSSSVVSSADPNGILWTARNMTRHYKDIKIARIEVGGLELNQQIIDLLQKNIGQQIHQMESTITGLSPQQIQEYLIPLSLQLKDPAEPLDEKTINLLPPTWVKRYQRKKIKRQIKTLTIITSIFVWGCFLSVLGAYLWVESQTRIFQNRVNRQTALPEEISSQITEINKLTDKVLKISQSSHSLQGVLNSIIRAKPMGVSLSYYQIDMDTGKIFLKGFASNRQSLIQFKKSLEESNDFSQIEIPISSFEAEQNLEFDLRLLYARAH